MRIAELNVVIYYDKIPLWYINRGYYKVARRFGFYVRVARTSEILFLPREHKNSYLRANV